MSDHMYDMETPLFDAIDLCKALDMMCDNLENHHREAFKVVVDKALDSLANVKDIWSKAFKAQGPKPQKPIRKLSSRLTLVDGKRST